jgi:FKBP-type peptidyl-prolyl cis-trans isomerase FkpA
MIFIHDVYWFVFAMENDIMNFMVDDQQLLIEDIKEGTGEAVKDGDHVVMHYTGWLEETEGSGKPGKKFDSSYDRGQPFETPIGVGYVIKGWDRGVIGMKVGGKRRLIIPYELGYGKYGMEPDIPGFATLIFEVELLKIK